ncbi:MAG: hypothetical protein C0606_03985 [Hyphomicrobiales bacterium]|nr:MAG: hypothetical protein C0606_03985 [Hyphomicrobiales bacterium]
MTFNLAFPLPFRAVRRVGIAACAIAALSAAAPVPASADAGTDFLAAISGSFKGRGVVRESADKAPENVICQLTSTLARDGTLLKNSGKCAGAQAKIKVAGSLGYLANTGQLTGSLLTTGSQDGTTKSTGKPTGSGATFTTVTFDNRQTVIARGKVTITLKGKSSYRLVVSVTEVSSGKTFTAADFTFNRR